jgi:hypothetical protein
VWDRNTQSSNYTTLQQQTESKYNFAAWQTESSMAVVPQDVIGIVTADPAAQDYLPVSASDAGADAGLSEPADNVRGDDLTILFPDPANPVTITRMRGDIARAALANDLVLQASANQTELSNIYQVTQSVNAPSCPPVPNPCPPCGGTSSGTSSSGIGSSSGATSSGVIGSQGGGTTTQSSSPGQQSFGCSAVPSDGDGGCAWIDVALGGLLGVSFLRSRVRRRRK